MAWAAGEDGDNGRLWGLSVDTEKVSGRVVLAAQGEKELVCSAHEEAQVIAQRLSVAFCEEPVRGFNAREGGKPHGSGVNEGAGVVDEIAAGRR